MRSISCTIGLLLLASGGPLRAAPLPEVGKPAPTISLRDREGALVSLADLAYAGEERSRRPRRVVLIDFFRTDCAPCRRSLSHLVTLHQRLRGQPVEILLVALLEEEDGQEKLDRFLKAHPLPFRILLDPYATAGKRYVMRAGSVQLPALFLVDRSGVLRAQYRGLTERTLPELMGRVEELLK